MRGKEALKICRDKGHDRVLGDEGGPALHHRNVRVAHWARATRRDTISVEIFYRDDGRSVSGNRGGDVWGTERGKKVLEL